MRLWHVATASLLATLVGHTGVIKAVRFKPDGTKVRHTHNIPPTHRTTSGIKVGRNGGVHEGRNGRMHGGGGRVHWRAGWGQA